jgi:hypothetical protein
MKTWASILFVLLCLSVKSVLADQFTVTTTVEQQTALVALAATESRTPAQTVQAILDRVLDQQVRQQQARRDFQLQKALEGASPETVAAVRQLLGLR